MVTRASSRSRSRRGGDSGAHWISYSDMMASLLLVFVLAVCYSVYQYYNMLAIKTQQLNEQQAELDRAQITLAQREEEVETLNVTLMGKQEELAQIQIQLTQQEEDLKNAESALKGKQEELDALQIQLTEQEEDLNAMQLVLTSQQEQIENLLGVRTEIIQALSTELNRSGLSAKVDKDTGDIMLDSAVFFDTNSYTIKPEGQAMLNQFLPVYLSVLMSDRYSDFVGEIIIEGHTDTDGSYVTNLRLSQNRALQVAMYCLEMPSLNNRQVEKLQDVLTAKGRSFSDPIYYPDGVTVNKDASRRVEFKFRLKDAEMIQEMNRILQESGGGSY